MEVQQSFFNHERKSRQSDPRSGRPGQEANPGCGSCGIEQPGINVNFGAPEGGN
jgi:hypothetical protein